MSSSESSSNFDAKTFPFVPSVQPVESAEASVPPYQSQPAQQLVSPIVHAPAVAVGRFNSGLGLIWSGVILNLVGLYPLFLLISSFANPRHMVTVGAWLLVSPLLFIGTLLSGSGIKEKGYQNNSIRIFGIVSFFVGIVLFFIPVIASLLYGMRIGS